ncbi:LysR family transcriptional regulator [Arthrobacter pigmenti]
MYSLDLIHSFVALAEELHFGRAAERLNMTQPPLSRQIQKLERAIEVQLFERNSRGVTLTPAGTAFHTEARKLLDLAETGPKRARRIADGSEGLIRIGFTAASAFSVLEVLLNSLEVNTPGIDVELREMVTSEQVTALTNGEIDLGLGRPPVDPQLFESRLIYREPLVVALPKGHHLAQLHRPITADDLNGVDLITHSPTKARHFDDLSGGVVSTRQAKFFNTASQSLTMLLLVRAGRGVALVIKSAQVLGIDGVEYRELSGFDADPLELHAIWLRGSNNPTLKRVLNFVKLTE